MITSCPGIYAKINISKWLKNFKNPVMIKLNNRNIEYDNK